MAIGVASLNTFSPFSWRCGQRTLCNRQWATRASCPGQVAEAQETNLEHIMSRLEAVIALESAELLAMTMSQASSFST